MTSNIIEIVSNIVNPNQRDKDRYFGSFLKIVISGGIVSLFNKERQRFLIQRKPALF